MDGFQKKAVMIRPDYSKLPPRYQLDATKKDVQAMKNALTGKFIFKEEDIKVVHDDQATKENILKELSELAKSCEPHSVVFLYYSGHGSYLKHSQDEGLLPTVLEWPTDKPMEEICITGQHLLPFFEELSKKSVHCTVIFDCCHSGYLYRDVDEEEGMKIKQFFPEPRTKSCDTESENTKYTKADRGGWMPENKDHFFYISACASEQKAVEILKGGLLTVSIVETLDKLPSLDQVNYKSFFRLLMKEFQILKNNQPWKINQMPQFESVHSNTALFGIARVDQAEGGVEITDVISPDEVILNSGFAQGLRAGRYSVFEATASAESVKKGISSPDYIGTITVNDGQIDVAEASGSPYADSIRRPITPGCLAYLKSPDSFSHSVYICLAAGSVDEKTRESLIKELKDTLMYNVFTNPPKVVNPELITITYETIKSKSCWVARTAGEIFVPPISAGIDQEFIMVKNLQKYTKYHLVQDITKSPKNEKLLLKNVSLKVYKAEKVGRWRRGRKEYMIEQELKKASTVEVTKVNDRRVILRAHEPAGRGIKYGTGDSFIYQVKNDNNTEVHICVILCQCDGEIKAIYPPKEGATAPLPGGETFGDIKPVFLPGDCLRAMAEPDPGEQEPNVTYDTLILLASSKPVNYEALMQSPLLTDSNVLRSKDMYSDKNLLASIEKLLNMKKRNTPDDDMEEMKYMYKKVQIFQTKQESP